LTIEGLIKANGFSGSVKLSTVVKLRSFKLRTNLQSDGGIQLGPNGADVPVNTLRLVADVVVTVHDQDIRLQFETPYIAKSSSSTDSFCKFENLKP
jgi:hypothetical protein